MNIDSDNKEIVLIHDSIKIRFDDRIFDKIK